MGATRWSSLVIRPCPAFRNQMSAYVLGESGHRPACLEVDHDDQYRDAAEAPAMHPGGHPAHEGARQSPGAALVSSSIS